MKRLFSVVQLYVGCVLLLWSTSLEAAPNIVSVYPSRVVANSELELNGSGFGVFPGEVIADYGHGFFYALKHTDWRDRRIRVVIPDLGKGLNIKLMVRAAHQSSPAVAVVIQPDVKPGRQGTARKTHLLSVGDKGEDVFKVINPPALCGKKSTLFDHATITFDQKRFADAQFVSLPRKGCSRCRNIRVRWYNEPTGKLAYRVTIFQRHIEGICPQRIRTNSR